LEPVSLEAEESPVQANCLSAESATGLRERPASNLKMKMLLAQKLERLPTCCRTHCRRCSRNLPIGLR
jgi:hypothetical protein